MRTRPFTRPVPAGFTMLELTLVIAMIGVLLAVASFSFLGVIGRSKGRATEATLHVIEVALNDYHMTHNAFPPDLHALETGKFIKPGGTLDGWKHELIYSVPGPDKDHPYVLGSAGEDGNAGNEDDIDVWTLNTKPAN